MITQIIIATALAVVLVVGIVSATAPAFADNNSIKQHSNTNIHIKGGSGSTNTGAVDNDNTAAIVDN
jgi:hypothetical protein